MAKLSYGSYYFSTPALTTLSAATAAKAAGNTTALELPADAQFTHSDNRLTYAGAITRDFVVMAELKLQKTAGSDSDVTVHMAKNGTPITGLSPTIDLTPLISLNSAGSPVFDDMELLFSLSGTVQLANTDYLEIWVETDTGDDVTVQGGTVTVKVAG